MSDAAQSPGSLYSYALQNESDFSQRDQVALLEKMISQQHGKLQMFLEEQLKQQSTLFDSRLQSNCDQIMLLLLKSDRKPFSVTSQQSQSFPSRLNPAGTNDMRGDIDTLSSSSGQIQRPVACMFPDDTGGTGEIQAQHDNSPLDPLRENACPEGEVPKHVASVHFARKSRLQSFYSFTDRMSCYTVATTPTTVGKATGSSRGTTKSLDSRSSKDSSLAAKFSHAISIGSSGERPIQTSGANLLQGVSVSDLEPPRQLMPIHSKRFQAVIFLSIVINALQMGLQVDINGGSWNTVWEVCDQFFTAVFAVEMVMKIYYMRRDYFYDSWNVLDFIICCSSMLDSWVIPLVTGDAGGALWQMLQLLRLLRMVKVLRMRRDLVLLVEGLLASMKSMFWVSLLLLLAIYTSAILCVEIIGNDRDVDIYRNEGYDNLRYFGTLPRSMLTLVSISIVDTWATHVVPISRVQPFMIAFFIFFLIMTSFALMNSIIGIIVEQTSAATAKMTEMDERNKRLFKRDRVEELIGILKQVDASSDGFITSDEMMSAKDNKDLARILDSIDLPPGFSLIDLHTMLDARGDGLVSTEAFLSGMFQLIFCNEFQSHCLSKLSIAQIKRVVYELRNDIFEELLEMKVIRDQVMSLQKISQSMSRQLSSMQVQFQRNVVQEQEQRSSADVKAVHAREKQSRHEPLAGLDEVCFNAAIYEYFESNDAENQNSLSGAASTQRSLWRSCDCEALSEQPEEATSLISRGGLRAT